MRFVGKIRTKERAHKIWFNDICNVEIMLPCKHFVKYWDTTFLYQIPIEYQQKKTTWVGICAQSNIAIIYLTIYCNTLLISFNFITHLLSVSHCNVNTDQSIVNLNAMSTLSTTYFFNWKFLLLLGIYWISDKCIKIKHLIYP